MIYTYTEETSFLDQRHQLSLVHTGMH